ncbi:cutinase family protein [Tsukamurella conjunctivitidis]|uniref:Cutinase family protein n=1 Tax=Tsukamurella conjunctivitidis TaxID=2592068 RepID=A0A5C5RXS0_9ACTN|nr:cutinase family protein [Tsukamurella conjunctivitidis]TWS27278.1 cutinase family protein [Tsukamurella conjunctivitidis]
MSVPNYPARFTAGCSIPFVLFMGLAVITDPPAAQAAPCPATMNFAVGGTGDPTGVYTPGVPLGPRTNVWYPGTVDDNAQRVGRQNLTNAVNSFRTQCPSSHVSVYGFSGGAQIAGDWRDQNPGMRNVNVVLIGDPRAPGGLASVLPSVPGWWTNQGPRPASPIPTSNVCRANDPVCNLGNPLQDPIHAINTAIGWVTGAHNYAPHEINPAPGNHTPPSAPAIPEVVKVPVKVPTPRQLSPIEPFVSGQVQKQWTPPAVARGTAARNVGEVVPPVVAAALPPQVGQLLAGIPLPH